jgi:hypothetical protein
MYYSSISEIGKCGEEEIKKADRDLHKFKNRETSKLAGSINNKYEIW